MSKKSIRLGNVLLCDYVAKGENNKFVLVNAYSGDIVVQHFPATLPLGLYCEYIPDDLGHIDLIINIKIAGQLIIEANVSMEVVELAPQVIAISHFVANFESASAIEISMTSQGYRDTVALAKTIRLGIFGGPSTIASKQHAKQSQPAPKG